MKERKGPPGAALCFLFVTPTDPAPIRKTLAIVIVLTVCLAGVGSPKYCFVSTALAQAQDWEHTRSATFEEQDKVNPPKSGCIVFTGSRFVTS
jgi:hypothetical protein